MRRSETSSLHYSHHTRSLPYNYPHHDVLSPYHREMVFANLPTDYHFEQTWDDLSYVRNGNTVTTKSRRELGHSTTLPECTQSSP